MGLKSKINKLFIRTARTLTFRHGIYGKTGRGCRFMHGVNIDETCRIGNNCYFGRFATVTDAEIGNYCSFAPFSMIGPGEHSIDKPTTCYPLMRRACANCPSLTEKPITLGNDVWVGAYAVVLRGITVGDGAVIAAGAVVTKDVEPYTIVGGVPAHVIRKRFPEETIEKIRENGFWLCPIEKAAEKVVELENSGLFANEK